MPLLSCDVIKADGSLNRAPGSHPYAMEVVSPILKGQTGIDALKAVCSVLSAEATVNSTCGLHVHHGVDTLRENLNALARNYFNNENHFYSVLPNSRQAGSYCQRWRERTVFNLAELNRIGASSWYSRNIGTRRCGLNFESLSMRNTVEFRMHSGTVEFEKIKNWATFTQAFVDASLAGTVLNAENFEAFVSFFEHDPQVAPVAPVATATHAPTFINALAKKKKMPKAGTKAGMLAEMLLDGTLTKNEIAGRLQVMFGAMPNTDMIAQVNIRIAEFKSLKYGYGANIVETRGVVRWLPLSTGSNVVNITGNVHFDDEVKRACVWMRARFSAHQARRDQQGARRAA